MTEQEKTEPTPKRREVEKSQCETAVAVGDDTVAPGQTGDNDES